MPSDARAKKFERLRDRLIAKSETSKAKWRELQSEGLRGFGRESESVTRKRLSSIAALKKQVKILDARVADAHNAALREYGLSDQFGRPHLDASRLPNPNLITPLRSLIGKTLRIVKQGGKIVGIPVGRGR